ncbi:MAG: hypothetical protein PHF87_09395 [Desulfotomaculaceae bacterium]|nr:hypothetical protein [Desulfotomaculaceae bacterium]
MKQEVIDIEVDVSFKGSASKTRKAKKEGAFKVYNPRGGTPKVKETFRLVGVLDKEKNIISTSPTSARNNSRQKMWRSYTGRAGVWNCFLRN